MKVEIIAVGATLAAVWYVAWVRNRAFNEGFEAAMSLVSQTSNNDDPYNMGWLGDWPYGGTKGSG